MKKIFSISLLTALASASFQALAYYNLRAGLYNIDRTTYYVDGRGAYCQNYAYDNRWRQLTPYEASELSNMLYTGVCGHP